MIRKSPPIMHRFRAVGANGFPIPSFIRGIATASICLGLTWASLPGSWAMAAQPAPSGKTAAPAKTQPQPQGQAPSAGDAEKLAIAIEALNRLKGMDLEANAAVKTAVYKVLGQVRGRPQFVEIVRDFKIKDQDAELLQVALKNADNATGVDAFQMILENGSTDILKGVLEGSNRDHAALLTVLAGNSGANQIAPLLKPVIEQSRFDLPLRQQALRALLKVETGVASILASAIEGKLLDDLKPLASTELTKVRWENLRAQAAQILPPGGAAQAAKQLPPVSELVKRTGNPMRGANIYRREDTGCIRCHQIHNEGIDFGPKLTEIGTKLGKEALYEAILNPSAGVSFGFEAWALELKNGDEHFGLIVSETADEIALKAQTGIVSRYRKTDVVRKDQQKTSIMPAGLEQTMTESELIDLVEYLTTLKKAN